MTSSGYKKSPDTDTIIAKSMGIYIMGYILPLEQFCKRVAQHPDQPYLQQPYQGVWHCYSWKSVDHQARVIAQCLLSKGFLPGDRIAILGKNSAEWVIADIAIMMAGLISVPIFDTAGEQTISHILQHSAAKAVFIGKLQDNSAAKLATSNLLTIGFPYENVAADEQWSDWLENNLPLQRLNLPDPEDMATLVYTSGSEGLPKGVVLTYKNLAAQALGFVELLPIQTAQQTQRLLSYLPMAHITERSFVTMASLYCPLCIYFVGSADTFIADIHYAKPTFFLSVPRLWIKFQGAVLEKIPHRRLDFLLKLPFVGKWLAAKIRKQLGFAETTLFGCGSAPIAIETLRWYKKIGVPISEGWGMTETTGAACGNLPFIPEQLGTIGRPAPGIEMKLGEGDEILIRGDAIFSEYYLDPERTKKAFVDHWFKTGDCGEVNSQGAWKITGRIKEQFKTAKGKYVAPTPIEKLFSVNSDIEQVCVLGEGRKQPVALIVLGAGFKRGDPQLEKTLQATLDLVNSKLEHHAQLDCLIVSREPWTIENQMLTPTLKLKRNKIEEAYSELIANNYEKKVIWQ